ncbi:MAG: SpoIIE family protein phosphatase [Atopobiaceae bacterium]|nr:SpoIIE family protein phosphatase [Atopobiaceae bacterium]
MRRSLYVRTLIWASVALGIALTVAVVASLRFNEEKALDEGYKRTHMVASAVNALFDATDLPAVAHDPHSSEFASARSDLRGICKEFEMDYVYLYQLDTKAELRRYLMAVASDDESDELIVSLNLESEPLEGAYVEQETAAMSGTPMKTPNYIDNKYGEMCSWFFPLYHVNDIVGIIGCDLNMRALRRSIGESSRLLSLIMGVQLVGVVAAILFMLRKHVIVPLETIRGHISTYVDASSTHDYAIQPPPLAFSSGDEIQQIADAFDTMSADLSEHVRRSRQLMEERVATETELDVARRIQAGIVPEENRLEGNGFEAFAYAHSARAVGGDFYDLFELDDGRVAAVIGDVSGKGVSAALFMVMVRTRMHEKLMMDIGPAQALLQTNADLCEQNPMMLFVTAFACILDPATGTLTYANAGHTPPVLLGEDMQVMRPEHGDALGLFDDVVLEEKSLVMAPGTGIILYTDGVTEAANEEHGFFGEGRLLDAARMANGAGAEGVVRGVHDAVEAFVAQYEQFDDLTMLALMRTKDAWPARSIELEPELALLARIREELSAELDAKATLKRVFLAVDEAFTNIASYAQATTVTLSYGWRDDAFVVELVDDGVAFNPLAQPREEKDFEDCADGGMGISLILSVADDATYERIDDHNVLTLTFGC